MKNSLLILTLCWSCAYLSSNAQNVTSCNANFEFTVTGNSVQFTPAINSVPRLHHWEFGDGDISDASNPTHAYYNPGTYRVLHRVYDSLRTCFDTVAKLVTITQVGECGFRPGFHFVQDSLNCKTVHFFNSTQSSTTALHYTWKFGDSTTSNDVSPSHTYADTGYYNVCLVVEGGNNCQLQYCVLIGVHCAVCSINTNFEYNIDTVNTNKVIFHNLTVSPPANVQYKWNFGDSAGSNDINPVHVYNHPGQYQVCLTAAISNSCQQQVCKNILIQAPECNVTARFEWRRDSLQWNKIWLNNTTFPVSQIWKTSWNYGDGTSSQDFNSFHTYNHAGNYNVCLKVTSLNGCTSNNCNTITVAPPVAACDTLHLSFLMRLTAQVPNVVSFIAVSNEPLTRQRWVITKDTLVNGSPAQVVLETNNPTYTFPLVGMYHVCLFGYANDSCVREVCDSIYVYRAVSDSSHREIPVYPNPSNNSVNLMLNLNSRAAISVTVLSAEGVPQRQIQVNGQAGNNVITIPVDKLSQGMYLVRLQYAGQVRLARFQKL
jgi:PKD repeat protein